MSRNLARTADLLQGQANRAPTTSDIKDGRCPKCGCRALARTMGELDLSCIMCGAVIYDAGSITVALGEVA